MDTSERKLVPILREGIDIVKAIFFKELRDHLRQSQSDWSPEFSSRVTAAVVNDLFGINNEEHAFVDFVRNNRQSIEEVKNRVGTELSSMRIPLTDALRTLVLCDCQEARDSSALLRQAEACGVLVMEREMPLPNHFIDLVRRLGTVKGILQPMQG